MGIALHQDELDYEFCSACGGFFNYLNPFTGWCRTCSIGFCESCGHAFKPDKNSRKVCINCIRFSWLERNIDAIERVMSARGITVVMAIQVVYDDNRPRCAMCGDTIKHGSKNDRGQTGRMSFCNKRDSCRRAAIRYHHYRKRNKLPDDIALEKALHGKHK